jgi:hypothetical protein
MRHRNTYKWWLASQVCSSGLLIYFIDLRYDDLKKSLKGVEGKGPSMA